jgi:hypothetical protein
MKMDVSSTDITKMTDGLVKAVAQRAGLTEDQSRKAVIAAFGYLKEQLPPSAARDLDTFVKGGGDLDGAIKWLLNLAGK